MSSSESIGLARRAASASANASAGRDADAAAAALAMAGANKTHTISNLAPPAISPHSLTAAVPGFFGSACCRRLHLMHTSKNAKLPRIQTESVNLWHFSRQPRSDCSKPHDKSLSTESAARNFFPPPLPHTHSLAQGTVDTQGRSSGKQARQCRVPANLAKRRHIATVTIVLVTSSSVTAVCIRVFHQFVTIPSGSSSIRSSCCYHPLVIGHGLGNLDWRRQD